MVSLSAFGMLRKHQKPDRARWCRILAWLDPAGYELAKSNVAEWDDHVDTHKSDFKMIVINGSATVAKVF